MWFISLCISAILTGSFVGLDGTALCAEPTAQVAAPPPKTFRLTDGTQLPIEEWPENYMATIWQPSIDMEKAKTIVEYDPSSTAAIGSIVLDAMHKKIYWIFSGGGRHGAICRANLDGSAREVLVKENPQFPGKEMEGPRSLCVVPELNKMFWVVRSYPPTPGATILEADLDGKNVKAKVNGLECYFLFVDLKTKKIFWNDGQRIQRAELDFSGVEDIGAKGRFNKPVAIDVSQNHVYARIAEGLVRQSIDGTTSERVYWTLSGTPNSPMQIAGSPRYLYWESNLALVRAPLDSLSNIERLTAGNESHAHFAVDAERNLFYWAADGGHKLVVAPLPKPWPKASRPAPPLIESWDSQSVSTGQRISLKGRGFRTASKVFWVGHPGGECVPAKFEIVSDEQLTSTAPKFTTACREASLIVVAEGGATVTLPADLMKTTKTVSLERTGAPNTTTHFVREGGWLSKVEGRVVFVEAKAAAGSGRRAGNVYFVKNGGCVGLLKLPSYLFFEPHARFSQPSPESTRIPVSAIRPSYVARLVQLTP